MAFCPPTFFSNITLHIFLQYYCNCTKTHFSIHMFSFVLLLSWCHCLGIIVFVFFSMRSPIHLHFCVIVLVSSSMQSFIHLCFGVFILMFSSIAISYMSSSRLLPLRWSSTRFSCGLLVVSFCDAFLWCLYLGVFYYGNLLHVFIWVSFAIAISYMSLPWCFL